MGSVLWLHSLLYPPPVCVYFSAQMAGLLCEEEVLEVDNVKYCGYCKYHFNKMVSFFIPALEGFGHVKTSSSSKIVSGL